MAALSVEKSTTVRTQLPPVPPPIRLAVGALDRVAPELVARGALRLWCTPTRAKTPAAIPGGTPFRTGPIVGQVWGDGPTVYLVHGWGGHRGQLRSLVEPLVAAGLRVVAYDAPSHGDSGPGALGRRRTTLPEMMSALGTVIAGHGPARAVVGHSMGAAASALAVLDGTPTERLVLVTPLADPSTYTVGFAHTLGFSERTRHRFVVRMEALAGRPLTQLDHRVEPERDQRRRRGDPPGREGDERLDHVVRDRQGDDPPDAPLQDRASARSYLTLRWHRRSTPGAGPRDRCAVRTPRSGAPGSSAG
jgi:pimeloyl-ACP methyl ester carboxylesterase